MAKSRMKDGIVKRGNSFHAVIRERGSNGKTKPVWSKAFTTRAEAEAYRDQRRVELREGTAVVPSGIKVGEYMDLWLPGHIKIRNLAPTTSAAYREKIENYIKPHIGGIRLQELTSGQLTDFYLALLTNPSARRESGLSAQTVVYVGRILRRALKDAVEVRNLLSVNCALLAPLPTTSRIDRDLWSAAEMKRFLEAADCGEHGALLWTYGATGARRGELLALRWANTDLDAGTLSIEESATFANGERHVGKTKNKEKRVVHLDQHSVAVLRAHQARQRELCLQAGEPWSNHGLVFCRRDGSPLPPDSPYTAMKAAIQLSGVPPLRLHDLRHLHATWLLEDGEPLHVVAQRLGHKDAMVTATIYAHVTKSQSASAAETWAARMAEGDVS